MVDVNYRETRIIRPHTGTRVTIEVTAKCDYMADVVNHAKYLLITKECAYVVCDGVLYLIDSKHHASYLILRVVNV